MQNLRLDFFRDFRPCLGVREVAAPGAQPARLWMWPCFPPARSRPPMPGRLGTAAVFAVSVTAMASKPLLLHLTRGDTGSRSALSPVHFQLAAEGCKVGFSLLALAVRLAVGLPAPLWRGLGHTARFM
ncbi:unnamed protein product, partial [Prorocentrum cordatum]